MRNFSVSLHFNPHSSSDGNSRCRTISFFGPGASEGGKFRSPLPDFSISIRQQILLKGVLLCFSPCKLNLFKKYGGINFCLPYQSGIILPGLLWEMPSTFFTARQRIVFRTWIYPGWSLSPIDASILPVPDSGSRSEEEEREHSRCGGGRLKAFSKKTP